MKGPVVGPGGRVTALTLLDPSTPPGAPSARRALEPHSPRGRSSRAPRALREGKMTVCFLPQVAHCGLGVHSHPLSTQAGIRGFHHFREKGLTRRGHHQRPQRPCFLSHLQRRGLWTKEVSHWEDLGAGLRGRVQAPPTASL